MKKVFKKIISAALTASMALGSMTFAPATVAAASITNIGGWNETLYAELSGVTDADVTSVSYSGATSGSLTGEDLQYLVRDNGSGGVRIDIPGLKPGDYTLTVNGSITGTANVPAQDRSGYAHYNYTDGVGAYNDDGTLKANAKVIYVTDENKDTVSVTSSDGTTVTGIGHILNSSGQVSTAQGTGLNSKGGIANNNQGIIKKLANDGTPLVVRFIGSVTPPDGLTAYDSVDYGGTVGDNGYMARMQSGKDITLEGIGYDAEINGWGFHFICQSSDPALGKSCEVKNLSFWGSPEDSFGAEGVQEGSTITASVERIWVHNCSFLPQVQSQYAESDKSEGDGCCDFKRGQYMTMSYCYFYLAHKTNLVGSADSCLQYNITWHHNMWENCEARGPLGRQANMHIYNNYYLKQSSYAMNPRANCYIFSEYNTMEYCKNPMQVTSGAIKSYNDTLLCCSGDQQGTIVTDKNAQVSTSNTYANFDTNSSICYIPSGDYLLQESAAEAKKTCLAYSGVQKQTVIDESSVDSSVITPSNRPTNSVELPFSATYGKGGANSPTATGYQVVANVVYNATKVTNSTDITIRGEGIVFSLAQQATVTMTGVSGTYVPVLSDSDGKLYITESGTAVLPAGVYVIQSSGFDAGTQTFKEAKIASLTMTATNPDEVVSTTTYVAPVTEATTQSATTTTTSQGDEPVETTTASTVPVDPSGAASMGTYVFGKSASGGDFNISAKNDTQGNVSFEFRDMTDAGARTRYDDGYGSIGLTLASDTIVAISSASNGIVATNVATYADTVFAVGEATATLSAGTYTIQGANAESNSTISKMVLASAEAEPATEATTAAPAVDPVGDSVDIALGSADAKVGDTVKIPVTLSGVTDLGLYSISVAYNSAVLTPTNVENGDMLTDPFFEFNITDDGSIEIAATNADGAVNSGATTLCYITFTAKAAGSTDLTLTVNAAKDSNEADITISSNTASKVTVTEASTPVEPSGTTPTDTIMWDMTNLVSGDNGNGLYLGEAMPYTAGSVTIGEYTFAGQAQGATNPTISNNIPTAGAYYQFTAPSDGKFTVAYMVGTNKTVQIFGATNSVAGNYVQTFDVTAGETYYIFGSGTKVVTYYLGFTPSAIPGDVNRDKNVDSVDAIIVLKYVSGITSETDFAAYDTAAADCDGNAGITLLDVVWILTHRSSSDEPVETTTESTTETTTETTTTTTTTTETTTTTTTETTTTTTTETTTETTTASQGGGESDTPVSLTALTNGATYTFGTGNITASNDNFEIVLAQDGDVNSQYIQLRSGASLTFKLDSDQTVEMNLGNKSSTLTSDTGASKDTTSSGVQTFELTAGTWTLNGASGTGVRVYYIKVGTTETEVTSEATTSTTTTTTEAPTTTTTEAQGGGDEPTGSGYVHNFTTDGTTSSFYTITGNLSTSKGTVTYNGLTLTQCLKMESSTSITFTATSSGALTLVFVEPAPTINIDGTKYTGSNGIISVDLAAGSHTITKADTANLFYMSFGGSGVVVTTESTTETTTSSSGSGGETTVPTADVELSAVPSTTVATVSTASALTSALSTANSSGGTIYIDTGEIALTSTLKVTGSNVAIVGVKQSDGTYPVLNYAGQSISDSSYGIKITGDNAIIQNVIVENAGDNGIAVQGAANTKIEHVISRYNYDTGIQLDDSATGSVLKYCYSYRNCDVDNNGNNADGFAPKLGCSDTKFYYCYSWDNADDGWDSYDKTTQTPLIEYYNSACWNNGYPSIFTGEYDFNRGRSIDKKMKTIQDILASDSSYESNYNSGNFTIGSSAKINGSAVSSWVSTANTNMNGNGFKFGSAYTATDGSITRKVGSCLAFDHKAKNFDCNNSTYVNGYFDNCIAFNSDTKPNYKLTNYNLLSWNNIYGWNGYSADDVNGKTVVTPSNTSELETAIYEIRNTIENTVMADKFPDGVSFDNIFSMVK